MYVFKKIDKASTTIKKKVINYTHNFNTSSLGINSINIVSGSISQSYWNSLNVLFYTSGSPRYAGETKFISKRGVGIGTPSSARITEISQLRKKGIQHLNKFHGYPSSSIITIPQQYYGEQIEENSFTLWDENLTDLDGNALQIRDDGYGNLYSTNAHHSQSADTHPSSSDNYVGNIFYKYGLVVITETGSWSGSVNYSDVANNTNYTLQLNSTNPITTHEYSCTLLPNEFNKSMNWSLRLPLSGSYDSIGEYTSSLLSNPYLASEFTSSDFTPYITTVNLYQLGDMDTPVATATFPKPIRKSNKIATIFKIKLDL
jgi:hypothetical protein